MGYVLIGPKRLADLHNGCRSLLMVISRLTTD
jgi:hypothetical protein